MTLANLISKLHEFLRQSDWVTVQLLICIHGAYIFKAFKLGYTQSIDKQPLQSRTKKKRGKAENVPYSLRMNPWFKIYSRISTGYMIYMMIRISLRVPIEALIALFDPDRSHCYMAGVFVFPFFQPLSMSVGYIFAACHLIWRATQALMRRPLNLTMCFYMMQSDSSIKKHLQLFGNEHTESRFRSLKEEGRLSQADLMLHKLLYYTVRHKTQTLFKLRPNRTLESRRKIATTAADSTIFSISIMWFAFWIFFPPIFFECLWDRNYIKKYPNCSPELDLRASRGELGYWSVSAFQPHRVWSGIFDGLENAIVWIDSAFSFYFNLPLAFQLNQDVIHYWQHLNGALNRLLTRLELNYYGNQSFENFELAQANECQTASRLKLSPTQLYRRADSNMNLVARETSAPTFKVLRPNDIVVDSKSEVSATQRYQLFTQTRDIDREILEVQAEIKDFFHQIAMVDEFISNVISACLSIWLFFWAIITYVSIVNVSGHVPLFLRVFEVFCFIVFPASTFFLLSLHRKTQSSYKCIVSLMALDQSEHKSRFIRILEYYTTKRSAYTVFHRTPFLATTYLTVIGWSASSLFIIENLFERINH